MKLTPEQIDRISFYIDDDALLISDLSRYDWRRQTDTVKQLFYVARMFADLGENRVVMVDGHISTRVKALALTSSSLKGFFNRRCHDYGLKSRRLILLDAVATSKTGGRGKGRSKLHFHGFFELPDGWTKTDLSKVLEQVFGRATPMGQRQFHMSSQDWTKAHSCNGVRARGAIGKLFYSLDHLGATYSCLDLNEGKRSRRAPSSRGADNRDSKRLARGIPSNFNAKAVFCDTKSKQLAKEAFEAWVAVKRGDVVHGKTTFAREARSAA